MFYVTLTLWARRPGDLLLTYTVWRMLLHSMLVHLSAAHHLEKKLSVYATFGVTVSCHVSCVAPLHYVDEADL